MLQYDDETFSVDLAYHSQVRWLSQGQLVEKVLSLQNKLSIFTKIGIYLANCQNKIFAEMLIFFCDVMSKQNQLNVFQQGETKSIYDIWQKIQAFRKKPTLLKSVLSRLRISAEHFPQIAKVVGRSCNVKEIYIAPTLADMTQIKNRLRSQITDVHLEDQLILKSTMLEPEITPLANGKQPHCSH